MHGARHRADQGDDKMQRPSAAAARHVLLARAAGRLRRAAPHHRLPPPEPRADHWAVGWSVFY